MSERTILEAQKELESLARGLKTKYPGIHLSEIVIEQPHCGIALRSPQGPKAILRGSYLELRAFENTYNRIRGLAVSFAISNWPDMKEPPGRGFMVISEIKGVKAQSWMEWPIIIAAVPSAITGIFSVISVLIGTFFGYYIGRSKSKS